MKNETKTFSEYKAPKCKMVEVSAKQVLCDSFGSANKAGNDLNESDEYTYGF